MNHEVKSYYYVDSFFQSTRTDQNSSYKFYKSLWFQIESFGLANSTKNGFPRFPRNIPYRERLKGPYCVFVFRCYWCLKVFPSVAYNLISSTVGLLLLLSAVVVLAFCCFFHCRFRLSSEFDSLVVNIFKGNNKWFHFNCFVE